MSDSGLLLACRYSYPPNSLSLCGPRQHAELQWYSSSKQTDLGTQELLQGFNTLYPYLCFIAGENGVTDPFDSNVVEAYWLGNKLLHKTKRQDFLRFLDDELHISKKGRKVETERLWDKITDGALPHHAFHVMNVYRRTGHLSIPHTIETMDACIINWGTVTQILDNSVIVRSRPLRVVDNKITFGEPMQRKLRLHGEKDVVLTSLVPGDTVSYHWGNICEQLTVSQTNNLSRYTHLAIQFANKDSQNVLQ